MEFWEADKNKDKAKALSLLTFKWLRELDLNQRPSGYESIKALFAGVSLVTIIYQNLSQMITPHEFQTILYSHFLSEFFTIFQNFCNFFATQMRLPPLYLSTQRHF